MKFIFKCPDCDAVSESIARDEAPLCGSLRVDDNRFPDGGFVRTETFTPHAAGVLIGQSVEPDNPLADLIPQTGDSDA